MAAPLIRTCAICKGRININQKKTDDFFIEVKNSKCTTYHTQCFIDSKTNQKRYAWSNEECESFIEECRDKYTEHLKTKEKTSHKKEKFSSTAKNDLCDYIFETYGITVLPKQFYMKLSGYFNGTNKLINKPILPEDLLEMWKQKQSFLDKTYNYNISHGKEFDDIVGRIYYDLAILVNKYDAYLQWKQKQAIVHAENVAKQQETKDKIDYTIINKPVKNNDKSVDIMSMLDEI